MTLITVISSCIIAILFSIVIFLMWYIIQAVRQIKVAEQYTHDLIEGIEELKNHMQDYTIHVHNVNEMEMFYGDETLRELIRHGKALVDTFEEYKIDYFPILELEEQSDYDDEDQTIIEEGIDSTNQT